MKRELVVGSAEIRFTEEEIKKHEKILNENEN